MGKVYAVGVGPGDPELLTLKGARVLREADVVCAPTGRGEAASYALSIVERFLDPDRQEVLVQVFPMTKDQAELDPFWREAAAQVAERVEKGLKVAFVTIGDPFLYSTFLYLYRILREEYPAIPVEVIPGITSIGAASAAAGIPLAVTSDRIAILPATYEEEKLVKALAEFDTIVLMKVHRDFDRVYELLVHMGLEQRGAFVRRVGSAAEEVIYDLASLVGKELDYLSLLIIRK